MKTLKQIPVPVAIIIMVVCILVGTAFGNNNALSDAKKEPELVLAEVSALASERAGKAKNMQVLAERSGISDADINALKAAVDGLQNATRADKIAEANRTLTTAAENVNAQLQLTASDADKRLSTGVMDDLSSLEHMISRSAATYNDSVAKVESLYKELPMRWVIGGLPEEYK